MWSISHSIPASFDFLDFWQESPEISFILRIVNYKFEAMAAGTQCLKVVLLILLQNVCRTMCRTTSNDFDKISIDVSGSVDSGALLYKFPHISGYRYLMSSSPDSNFFFLSNAEGLTTATRLDGLTNKNVSLSVCEELENETKVVPVHLRVVASLKVPVVFGRVVENRPPGTPVTFVNASLGKMNIFLASLIPTKSSNFN